MPIIRTLLFAIMSLLCLPAQAQGEGASVAALARTYLGAPYRFGGTGPDGFDCSGLVQYVHRVLGREVPRTTHVQYLFAEPVSLAELREGDLLFFRLRGRLSHVGIYVGAGRFIHAPSRGKAVTYGELTNPFWRARFEGAGRFSGSELARAGRMPAQIILSTIQD